MCLNVSSKWGPGRTPLEYIRFDVQSKSKLKKSKWSKDMKYPGLPSTSASLPAEMKSKSSRQQDYHRAYVKQQPAWDFPWSTPLVCTITISVPQEKPFSAQPGIRNETSSRMPGLGWQCMHSNSNLTFQIVFQILRYLHCGNISWSLRRTPQRQGQLPQHADCYRTAESTNRHFMGWVRAKILLR